MNDAIQSFENLVRSIISSWAYQWKNFVSPGYIQTISKSYFLKKTSIKSHPALTFDNSPIIKTKHHKHLELILDEKLNFKKQLKEKMSKAYKGITVLRKLQNIIPTNSLKNFFYTPSFRLW